MGKHCAAYGCRNSSVKDEDKGISLHKFPKESTLRNKWAFAMNRKGFQPNNYSSVCSAYPPRLDPLNPRGTTKYSYDTSVFTVSWSVADTIRILSPLPVGREWLKLPFVKWGSIAGVGLKSSSPACSKSIDYSCHVSSFLPAAHCQCQLPSSGRSLALNHIATSCLGGKLRARRRISPLNVFSMLAAVSPSLLNYYVCGEVPL